MQILKIKFWRRTLPRGSEVWRSCWLQSKNLFKNFAYDTSLRKSDVIGKGSKKKKVGKFPIEGGGYWKFWKLFPTFFIYFLIWSESSKNAKNFSFKGWHHPLPPLPTQPVGNFPTFLTFPYFAHFLLLFMPKLSLNSY